MELLGYIVLAAMGITLSLLGEGGSILMIPILVYLLDVPIILATSYSLVVEGSTAFMGLLRYRHHILFKKAILFLIPSVLGVFATRYFMIPSLPHTISSLSMNKVLVILLLIFMSAAGYFMIKNSPIDSSNNRPKNQNIKVILIGLALGTVMGLLGAGGGFLIMPILVLLMGFTMQEAVPTSLFIITVNSLIGFAADQHHFIASDWGNLEKIFSTSTSWNADGALYCKICKLKNFKKSLWIFYMDRWNSNSYKGIYFIKKGGIYDH